MFQINTSNIDPRIFGPGVYLLIDGDEVIYVGASINLGQRINSWRNRAEFDQIRVIYCEKDEASAIEKELIAEHRPRLNSAGVDGGYVSPDGFWFAQQKVTYRHPDDSRVRLSSRQEYIAALDRDINATDLVTMKITSNVNKSEKAIQLAQIGFPQPDYCIGQNWPRWRQRTVMSWIDEQIAKRDHGRSA